MTRRLTGDAGSSLLSAYLLMLSFTGGAILWLTREVDRAVSTSAEADSVAFQAARAAAQALDPASLRGAEPAIDPATAITRANEAAALLLAANDSTGHVTAVEVGPAGDRVTVLVELTEAGRTVTGRGTARIAVGVTQEGDG